MDRPTASLVRATGRFAIALCIAHASRAAADEPGQAGMACAAAPAPATAAYRDSVTSANQRLGVPQGYAPEHALVLVPEATTLVVAGRDIRGRPVRLAPAAAVALQEMFVAADSEGVRLRIVSGYRSAKYQADLLHDKLHRGMKLDAALRINAPPGYSEHQSGCAVDLTTPHGIAADGSFAHTRAYAWLTRHAAGFGFHLSYPRGNPQGIEFEPWHWRFVASTTPSASTNSGLAPAEHANRPAAAATGGLPDIE